MFNGVWVTPDKANPQILEITREHDIVYIPWRQLIAFVVERLD